MLVEDEEGGVLAATERAPSRCALLVTAAATGLLVVVVSFFVVLSPIRAMQEDDALHPHQQLPPLRGAVPFDLRIEEVSPSYPLPKLQSFGWAVDEESGRWLLVAGRTGGLHGFDPSNSFPTAAQNHHFHVFDPKQGFKSWKLSVLDLPVKLADALQATNAQFRQDGNKLYMIGGYGYSRTRRDFVTHDLFISIDVATAVNAVIAQNTSILADSIRYVSEPRLQLSGGGLQKLNGWFFLVLGAYFEGAYPHPNSVIQYSQSIKMFQVVDEPQQDLQIVLFRQLNATGDQVYQWHRRDLHVLPAVLPGGQEFAIDIYGGVFTPVNSLPFLFPMRVTAPDANNVLVVTDYSYQQLFSQYECASMVTYDNSTGNLMVTFFGGMGLSYVTSDNEVTQDIRTPFVSIVSTMTRYADGHSTERVHNKSSLKGLRGTNAAFVPHPKLPLLGGGVIDLAKLDSFQAGRHTLVGHMYGGILAEQPNFGSTDATSSLFAIYLTPLV